MLLAAALVAAPWTLRNHRELGAWVMVSTNGGITLLTGNNDSAQGGYTPNDPVVDRLNARRELAEVGYDTEAKRLGAEWIKAHPARFAELMPRKLFYLWAMDGEGQWAYEGGMSGFAHYKGAFTLLRYVNQSYYGALLLGFVIAVLVLARRRRAQGLRLIDWWLLPYAIALYPSVIAMVFSGQPRFHYIVMPFVCMAVGGLLARWIADQPPRSNCTPQSRSNK